MSKKNRINVLSYGTKIWAELFFVLSQITRLPDRRADRETTFSRLDRAYSMQRGKNDTCFAQRNWRADKDRSERIAIRHYCIVKRLTPQF